MAKKDETQVENVIIQDDESKVTATVDSTDTTEEMEVEVPDATAEVDEVEDDTVDSETADATKLEGAIKDENYGNDDSDNSSTNENESTAKDSADTEPKTTKIDSIERKVMNTNRIMKVYAQPNTKSRMYTFVGTYTITGKVCGNFKEIVCSVAGIGKFTGYISL